MPGAIPLPGSPSAVVLGSAEGLFTGFTGAGCPVCRYVAEAGERYLAWFALEGHADMAGISRLCASLGMCPRHTRTLMSQPGADIRLTAVNTYLVGAAQRQLSAKRARLASCPACEHDRAAAGRALDILLDGLAEGLVKDHYLAAGGMCVPHMRAGAVRARRQVAGWLLQAAGPGAASPPPVLDSLAGGADHDARSRAILRNGLPAVGREPPGICPVCLAAARGECQELLRVAGLTSHPACDSLHQLDAGAGSLCGAHLHDAALTGSCAVPALLAWQAALGAAELSRLRARRPLRMGGHHRAAECTVCRAREEAAAQELQRQGALLRERPPAKSGGPALCVRDVLRLRAADRAAGRVASGHAARRAESLLSELEQAFRERTRTGPQAGRGKVPSAWRRAAGFLDGRVFGGSLSAQ